MSYILDALRRLEKDKEAAQKGANPMEAILSGDPTGRRTTDINWVSWGAVASLIVIAIVASTYFITRQFLLAPDERAPEKSEVALSAHSSAGSQEKVSPPARNEEIRIPAEAVERRQADRNIVSLPAAAEAGGEEMPADSRGMPEKPVTLKREDPAAGISAFPKKPLPFTPKMKAREVVEETEPGIVDQAPAVLPEAEVYQPWLGEEIKISAIAFSQDPKSRFAVVNLKTVRQGDSVFGLEIREIQEDGIVFVQGGEKYKIFLGRR